MYIVSRLMLGFGFLFCIISGSSLVGELGHPRERAALTAFFNASYFFGAILAAAISIGTVEIKGNWSWRLPSLLQIMPSLLQICTVLYVVFMLLPVNMILIMTYSLLPESPRYLISKGRDNEAHAILTKYHGSRPLFKSRWRVPNNPGAHSSHKVVCAAVPSSRPSSAGSLSCPVTPCCHTTPTSSSKFWATQHHMPRVVSTSPTKFGVW
jgi:MFS family permease